MIIKKSTVRIIITLSIVLIIPFVQKQWFNLYLLNNFSLYSILYYLSGTICPSLICLYSLNNLTNYNFDKYKINSKKIITGKALLILVAVNLIILSYLIVDYFYLNFDLLINLFFEGIKIQPPETFYSIFFIFIIATLLIIKRPRIFLKKVILVNFILVSFFIWYLKINNIEIDSKFYFYKYYFLDNIYLINIFILIAIEIAYFIWLFISYKTNLSDWIVPIPSVRDVVNILRVFIFYTFIVMYYLILTK